MAITFTKIGEEWGVRIPSGESHKQGEEVEVRKRSGETTKVVLDECVKSYDEADLWSLARRKQEGFRFAKLGTTWAVRAPESYTEGPGDEVEITKRDGSTRTVTLGEKLEVNGQTMFLIVKKEKAKEGVSA